jgi:kynurenine formamidase
MQIVDLTQTIINRMQVYPGDEPPMLYQTHLLDFDGYTNFHLTIGMHAGTHIDGPMHMAHSNQFISEIAVEKFIGKACVLDISKSKVFDDVNLVKEKVTGYKFVLFYTGYGELFGTPQYVKDYPLISENVANTLVDLGVELIGVDNLDPDMFPHTVHKILLDKGILIAENLSNLDKLLTLKEFTLVALPLKIRTDSAPARIVAIID